MRLFNQSDKQPDHYHLRKIVFIGPEKTGKSAALNQLINQKFQSEYDMTIGVEFSQKTINHQNKTIKFQIWDTAGAVRFRSITNSYYRGAMLTAIFVDLNDIENSIQNSMDFIKKAVMYFDTETKFAIMYTKADLARENNTMPSLEELTQYTGQLHGALGNSAPEMLYHHITSAATGEGLNDTLLQAFENQISPPPRVIKVAAPFKLDLPEDEDEDRACNRAFIY